MRIFLLIIACCCAAGTTLADSSSSSAEDEQREIPPTMSRAEFHRFHQLLMGKGKTNWLRESGKVEEICRLFNRAEFQLRSNRIPSVNEAANVQIPIDNPQLWEQHKTEVNRCCQQQDRLDLGCQSDSDQSCCQLEGPQRYECFRRSEDHSVNAEGRRLSPELNFFDWTADVAQLSRSLPDIFPESPENGGAEGDCVDPTATRLSCARQCCSAGADSGKQISTGCPYLQCREFGRSYVANHTEIRAKFACEFVFILCCERQYYKGFYGRSGGETGGVEGDSLD